MIPGEGGKGEGGKKEGGKGAGMRGRVASCPTARRCPRRAPGTTRSPNLLRSL
jgi:hypothetical protein